jgi:hypothetical protein
VKRALLFLAISSAFPSAASADSILKVAITNSGSFSSGSETAVSLTFNWDPNTNVLSDFDLQTSGPLVFSQNPSSVLFEGHAIAGMTFLDLAGDGLQFNYDDNTSFSLQPVIGNDQPGLFDIDCTPNPVCTDNGQAGIIFFHGQTVITQVAEPQPAELLLFGFLALGVGAFFRRRRKFKLAG